MNAGWVVGGPFLETDLERDLALIQLNIESVVHLSKRLLPAMVAGDDQVVAGSGKNLLQTMVARLAPGQFKAARLVVFTEPEDLEEE